MAPKPLDEGARPVCSVDGCERPRVRREKGKFRPMCNTHMGYNKWNRLGQLRQRPWLLYKGTTCESCGFVAEHECQLDVDHIDGNGKNNDPSNFQTLCANCHRLKTYRNQDWQRNPSDEIPVSTSTEGTNASAP